MNTNYKIVDESKKRSKFFEEMVGLYIIQTAV